jgi:hypothetical protein
VAEEGRLHDGGGELAPSGVDHQLLADLDVGGQEGQRDAVAELG